MTRPFNPLAPKTNRLQARSAEIKSWFRTQLELSDDTTITVSELACRDEGCPDIETVVGVMESGRPIQIYRIHKPLAEVVRDDVNLAIEDYADAQATSLDSVKA